jgi:hypothetical protein
MVRTTDADRAETIDRVAEVVETAPPLVPGSEVIDLGQLSRMTLGETGLEREVLALFDLQAGILLSRMANEPPKSVAGLAHTLTGSARGVGAWKVAEASEVVERFATAGAPTMLADAIGQLNAAVTEARARIATILAAR